MYEKCQHCHLFIEENDTDGDPTLAPYLHLHRGDEADEDIDNSHDAAPSGDFRTLDQWMVSGPPEMIARFY